MATHGTFGTALNCMDGRCQEKAYAFAKEKFGVDNVDMITEPGIDGLLAGEHSVVGTEVIPVKVEWIKAKTEISAKGHGSKQCVIFGHCGCAGNTVDLQGHNEHLRKAYETVKGWGLFDTILLAVFDEGFNLVELPVA